MPDTFGTPPVPDCDCARTAAPRHAATKQPEALDLGATVVPVLIKNYGRKIAVGVAVIAAVVIVYRLLRG